MVSFEVPEPATDAGTNAQLAPLGKPEQANATLPLNPAIAVTVTVEVAGLPGLTVAGESAAAEIWKFGLAGEDPPPQAFSPNNRPAMLSSPSSNRIKYLQTISVLLEPMSPPILGFTKQEKGNSIRPVITRYRRPHTNAFSVPTI
jgi:hypothetical protein